MDRLFGLGSWPTPQQAACHPGDLLYFSLEDGALPVLYAAVFGLLLLQRPNGFLQ